MPAQPAEVQEGRQAPSILHIHGAEARRRKGPRGSKRKLRNPLDPPIILLRCAPRPT